MIEDSAKVPSATFVRAPAKINLALDVLEKDSSGYHKIRTVFQEIPELYNEIEIKESSIASDNPAVQLLQKEYGIDKSVEIRIHRNIPISSGLGGESSNHAAILKALNQLWKLNLSQKELLKLAAKLGMDVPFFIIGGTALGTHFGEIITPLPPLYLHIEVRIKSITGDNKTAHAYATLNLKFCGKNRRKTEQLIKKIKTGDYTNIEKCFHNDFETLSPVPNGWHLSGAGPSLFKLEAVHAP